MSGWRKPRAASAAERIDPMRTIHKYTLLPGRLKVQMPKGAKVLTAREQIDDVCVWAEVDTTAPKEIRVFEVFGTGQAIPQGMGMEWRYVGTAHLEGGALVFHVYEYLGT